MNGSGLPRWREHHDLHQRRQVAARVGRTTAPAFVLGNNEFLLNIHVFFALHSRGWRGAAFCFCFLPGGRSPSATPLRKVERPSSNNFRPSSSGANLTLGDQAPGRRKAEDFGTVERVLHSRGWRGARGVSPSTLPSHEALDLGVVEGLAMCLETPRKRTMSTRTPP